MMERYRDSWKRKMGGRYDHILLYTSIKISIIQIHIIHII